jgi:hypothetical protein
MERLDTRSAPRISIVVISQGDVGQLKQALRVVLPAAAQIDAQTIVAVAAPSRAAERQLAGLGEFDVVHALAGSTRSELCDRAMKVARGDIVVLRNASAIGDASWLEGRSRRQSQAGLPARAVEREVPAIVEPFADVVRPRTVIGLADQITAVPAAASGPAAAPPT